MISLKNWITSLILSFLAFFVTTPVIYADPTTSPWMTSTIYLDGNKIDRFTTFQEGTLYVPISLVHKMMYAEGISDMWDGHLHNWIIRTPYKLFWQVYWQSSWPKPKGNGSIFINGQRQYEFVPYKVLHDPYTGKWNTYVSMQFANATLTALGFQESWRAALQTWEVGFNWGPYNTIPVMTFYSGDEYMAYSLQRLKVAEHVLPYDPVDPIQAVQSVTGLPFEQAIVDTYTRQGDPNTIPSTLNLAPSLDIYYVFGDYSMDQKHKYVIVIEGPPGNVKKPSLGENITPGNPPQWSYTIPGSSEFSIGIETNLLSKKTTLVIGQEIEKGH